MRSRCASAHHAPLFLAACLPRRLPGVVTHRSVCAVLAAPNQSALFAMATADVLLVNLWCHDIGREHGAGKPLLRTVLQVHLRMFTPRRTLLVFCVRDKTRTPEALLASTLGADLDRLWADLAKPPAVGADAPLGDFFDVRYVFLANYEERPEVFLQDVGELRHRLTSTHAPDSLASPPGRGVPGSALALSLRRIWADIKENKDLDLPAHKVMVATVRCEQVASAALQALQSHEEVVRLSAAGAGAAAAMTGLGLVLGGALAACVGEYDAQTQLFDTAVRTAKRAALLADAMEVLRPLHEAALGVARNKAMAGAKAALGGAGTQEAFNALAANVLRTATAGFDMDAAEATPQDADGASWADAVAAARARLVADVTRLVETARCAAAQHVCQELSVTCCRALGPTAAAALEAMAAPDVWPRLRRLLVDEQRRAIEALDAALAPLLPAGEAGVVGDDATSAGGEATPVVDVAALRLSLASALASCVQDKVRDAAAQVGPRLRARFGDAFAKDPATGLPRAWGPRDDVDAAAAVALREALDLLGVLAIMRLDGAADAPAQAAAKALRTLLPPGAAHEAATPLAPGTPGGTATSDVAPGSGGGLHPSLTCTAWEGVSSHWELLAPTACVAAWKALSTDTAYLVLQARTTQEAARRAAGGAPPLWAIAAMLVLGFDEILWLLRSPVTLLLLGTLLLFGRAVYAQMDVDSTIQALGLIPSLAVLAARLVPAMLAVLHKLIEAGAQAGATTANQVGQGQQAHGAQTSKKDD